MKYSLEISAKIYNDDTGECIEVRPDSDGLGMFEIRHLLDDKKVSANGILITKEQLPLLEEAIRIVVEKTKLG
jgi:hypothetical protein